MDLLRRLALTGMILALTTAPLRAETPALYVWADSLTLHAAPSFSAPAIAELAYGTAVEPLAPPGPLMPGSGVYPALQGNEPALLAKTPSGPQLHSFRLHGHWLKLRRAGAAQVGYAFDTYLLPLPVPRCELGRLSCETMTALGWSTCPDSAKLCDSVDDYSARTFGFLSRDRDDRASVEWTNRYRQNVVLEDASNEDPVMLWKRWTLPMLHSIDQAYVVMRRFYGDCSYLETYQPPLKVHLVGCGGIQKANVVLSRDGKAAVIDWYYLD